MPKFYCEYCGIYLTHSSPSGRKQHGEGRKHIQNKIDYYSELLVEAHTSGKLHTMNKLFLQQENKLPNFNQSTIKNPFNNTILNSNELSSVNIPGILPTKISYLPIPGQDIAISINPDPEYNSRAAFKN